MSTSPGINGEDFKARMDAFRLHFEAKLKGWVEGKASHLKGLVGEAYELAHAVKSLLLAGGKRLRPALLRCGYRATGAPETPALLDLCLAVECLHAYLLIHDDIMDRAETRRGQPAAHAEFRELHRSSAWFGNSSHYGDACGTLAGDLAASWATESLGDALLQIPRDVAKDIHHRFHRMMDEDIAGQHLEMRVAARRSATDDELKRILHLKSGAYSVQRPLELGAVLGGADAATLEVLSIIGRDLGEAFQLRDDILGLFGDSKATGKPVGGDLVEGKITCVIQEALKACTKEERTFLEQSLGRPLSDADTERVLQLLQRVGAKEKAESMIRVRTDRALRALDASQLPQEPREFLTALARGLLDGAGLPEASAPPAEAKGRDRKAEHIAHALNPALQGSRHAFEAYSFTHCALPELDFDQIETSTPFLGKTLRAPLLISCMTGGTQTAGTINRNLAIAAEAAGVALGVGSQRKALENPSQRVTFQVRTFAKTIPLLANLGAVQLNYGYGLDHCQRAVDMIEADALVLHLNPLQECIQPEGQRNFAGLIQKVGEISRKLSVPVILKEVGNGLSRAVVERLVAEGVTIFDVAGSGGTSFSRIEGARSEASTLGELFGDWGIPTPEALSALRELPGITVIGSGGIRQGLDVAKALALGADLVGAAYPFLRPALESPESVAEEIRRVIEGLKISMLCTGSRTIRDLKDAPIRRKTES